MYNRDDDSFTRDRDRTSNSRSYDEGRGSAFSWRGGYEGTNRDFSDRSASSRRRSGRNSAEEFGRGSDRDLIASDRVEGTDVYDRNGDKLGTIHNFMVEKRGGRVAFAVMKCSDGFLGMNERYYPLEWSELDYDERKGGYRVNMTEQDLDNRRSYDSQGRPVARGDNWQ